MKTLIDHQTLERLGSLLRNETRQQLSEHGLQPVQFEALHYLSVCNRYSDTPMGVTEFLGQTKGTVSQTLKVLEKRELIQKCPDEHDKRVTHLKMTNEGVQLIADILPLSLIQQASDGIEEQDIATINTTLQSLLSRFQQANNFRRFGMCERCVHNSQLDNGHYFCGLTKEELQPFEVKKICREHES
ncbi:MarR family transcriptional regulator [Gammaproteobacteria bacterium 45_16_T64]|nr:MarR family transcriptional regulator [Gammaproteobacteria bacterium 45_16_T64]